MAKVYSPPKELEKIFEYDRNKDFQSHEEECINELRKYCKAHTNSKSKYVGVVFRIPMADSFAQYMVFGTKPLELIHIPYGDAWNAPEYQTRGIRLQDIKDQVEWNARREELFKRNREQ